MNGLVKAYWTARGVGLDNVPLRVLWMIRNRLGVLERRLPAGELPADQLRAKFTDDYDAGDAGRFWRERSAGFFTGLSQVEAIRPALQKLVDPSIWKESVEAEIEDLARGRVRMFSRIRADFGWPVRFNHDPINDVDWPTGRHWSKYDAFDPKLSDNKCVWEASRFSWAFTLARQFGRSSDERAAALFWTMFENWDQQNPYGTTAQWSCGQESSFRAMAWLFAASAMLASPESTDRRLHRLTELVWYTGRHIEFNINYARSQKNNHAISEAVLLWTFGVLFPELRDAPGWRRKGSRILAEEVSRQIYDDGSYVQHSLNYHRLMMDDLIWALRLDALGSHSLPGVVQDCLGRAHRWLLEMIDTKTGHVPNYGANDGALVLPLSCCDYLDFRPVTQAAHYLLHGRRCFEPGPWDEKGFWLFGSEILDSPVESYNKKTFYSARTGGYYVLRGRQTWAMIRCHTYRDRPCQADMLHLDLWRFGENILRDGGSYRYNCEATWQHYFLSTAAHNTVTVDGLDQMLKGPRFLWFRWTKATLQRFAVSVDGRVGYFEGECSSRSRRSETIVHRRAVCRIEDTYIVIDDVCGSGEHDVCLRWRLHPSAWQEDMSIFSARIAGQQVALKVLAGSGFSVQLVSGQDGSHPEGWESLYYGEKTAVPTVIVAGTVELPTRIVTIIGDPANLPEVGALPMTADHPPTVPPGRGDGRGVVRVSGMEADLLGQVTDLSGGLIVGR